MFQFWMGSEFECLVFEPPLYLIYKLLWQVYLFEELMVFLTILTFDQHLKKIVQKLFQILQG